MIMVPLYSGIALAPSLSRTRTRGIDTRIRSLRDDPLGVPCHFPEMPVGVLEVAGIPAPGGVLRWLDDHRASALGLIHHGVDFGLRRDIVADGEFGRARAARRDAGI